MKNTPSFRGRPPLSLYEMPATPFLEGQFINARNTYLRVYRLGPCGVIVTKEYGLWHLSISHPDRYPSWDEIAEARYRIMPGEITAAMILPPESEYVNLNEHCFQVVQIDPSGLPPR